MFSYLSIYSSVLISSLVLTTLLALLTSWLCNLSGFLGRGVYRCMSSLLMTYLRLDLILALLSISDCFSAMFSIFCIILLSRSNCYTSDDLLKSCWSEITFCSDYSLVLRCETICSFLGERMAGETSLLSSIFSSIMRELIGRFSGISAVIWSSLISPSFWSSLSC